MDVLKEFAVILNNSAVRRVLWAVGNLQLCPWVDFSKVNKKKIRLKLDYFPMF